MSVYAFADLHLMDLPEGVLQQISSCFYAKQWAKGPALTCRILNRLSLPMLKVWSDCTSLPYDRMVHFTPVQISPSKYTSDSVIAWALQERHGVLNKSSFSPDSSACVTALPLLLMVCIS